MRINGPEGGPNPLEQPPVEIKLTPTERGFMRAEFTDKNGSKCSVQESSLAEEDAIWLGVDQDFKGKESTRMHLTREQVAALLPHLQRFVETGELREDEQ